MNTSVETRTRAKTLDFTEEYLIVYLDDGRVLQVPLAWYPKLQKAKPEQLRKFTWIGKGLGIEWEELDEHLSVEGFLKGLH